MKNCYVCKQQLPFESFYADKSQSSGYSSACKPCGRARRAAYAQKNKGKENARRLAWSKANPDTQAAIKARHAASPEAREASRQYKKANPQVVRQFSSKRRAARKNAIMNWEQDLTDYVFAEACDLAVIRERVTGVKWQVDHIIPLQGKLVSGLHVWNNFQVITEAANRKKRNHYAL